MSARSLRVVAAPAPAAHSRVLGMVLGGGAQVLALATLPLWVVKWVLFRPRVRLRVYLLARIFRTSRWLYPSLMAREPPAEAAAVPARPLIAAPPGAWDAVALTQVTAPLAPRFQDSVHCPPAVAPEACPGFILVPRSAPPQAEGDKIIIYFHGGAYVVGHPLWTPFALKMADVTGTRVYAAQYRKAVESATAWPSPLLDGLAAWSYVTTQLGFEPADVVLMGDSAGGHLALAVASHLGQQGLPLPGGLALASPWADLTMSHRSWHEKPEDYLSEAWGRTAIESITRHYTPDAVHGAELSPALAPRGAFAQLAAAGTRVFISVGTQETLEDEVRALARNLRGDGVHVAFWDDVDGLHDAPVFTPLFGDESSFDGFAAGVVELLAEMGRTGPEAGSKAEGGEEGSGEKEKGA